MTAMNIRQKSKHAISILTWGIIVFVIDQLCQYVTVLTLLARRSNRSGLGSNLLEFVSSIADSLYDIISFPVMWVKPNTRFDSEFWITFLILLFWGIALHLSRVGLGLVLAFAKRRCHSRDTWSTTDRHHC